jgi:hypothetical protein
MKLEYLWDIDLPADLVTACLRQDGPAAAARGGNYYADGMHGPARRRLAILASAPGMKASLADAVVEAHDRRQPSLSDIRAPRDADRRRKGGRSDHTQSFAKSAVHLLGAQDVALALQTDEHRE